MYLAFVRGEGKIRTYNDATTKDELPFTHYALPPRAARPYLAFFDLNLRCLMSMACNCGEGKIRTCDLSDISATLL